MLYLGTSPSSADVTHALDHHHIGLMCQPASNRPRVGWTWAADNGCFSATWNEARWLRWIDDDRLPRAGCVFAAVPDVVGDPVLTLRRWNRYSERVRDAGFPLAFVVQDGAERDLDWIPPFSHFDCLFIGGSTEAKMSELMIELAMYAREHHKWVHVGRVNSWSRFQAWAPFADSCDGTMLAYAPSINLERLRRWRADHEIQPQFRLSALPETERASTSL